MIELKRSIHDKIDKLDDPAYWDMLNTMIHHKDNVFEIPVQMKEGIRQGTEDIKNGDIHTMEDLEEKYKKWLRE